VLLALHGAMVADGYDDCEGDILARVRRLVGSSCPIVSTLDMHGNLSQAMVDAASVLVAYDTNPHLDTFERGVEAAQILCRMLDEHLRTAAAMALAQRAHDLDRPSAAQRRSRARPGAGKGPARGQRRRDGRFRVRGHAV